MPSIIPGFGYDIFISYRHKDNFPSAGHTHDGWVTEFVQHLRRELEATFKEDISIYFDENPHDGLRESHHVDKSLEGKLKCLILIPIISQTYCDPKSFAWQNEFCAFNKLVEEDSFGKNINLANGNVASRILPIKIHDLDAEDKRLVEDEMDEVLRAVEFIYKSQGVNRPLTPLDNPDKNQNKTFYRDQINKVAHSVKEIITALKSTDPLSELNPVSKTGSSTASPKRVGRVQESNTSVLKKWSVPLGIVLIVAAGLIYYNQSVSKPGFTGQQKSIAVLPFENIGSEKEKEYISNGITQEIINSLGKIEDLHGVTSWASARLYKKTERTPKDIGQELGVTSVVTGTIQKEADQLRVLAELTDVNTGKQIWSRTYNRKWGDVLTLQSELSQEIAGNLNALLTKDEKRRIESKMTNNPDAYEDFLKGKNNFYVIYQDQTIRKKRMKEAEEHFLAAIAKDSSFALAWSLLGENYVHMALNLDSADRFQYYDKALTAGIRGLTLGPELSETNMYMGEMLKSITLNPFSSLPFLKKAIELNPNNAEAYYLLAWLHMEMGDLDKVEGFLAKATQLDPESPGINSGWFLYFFFSRKVDRLRNFTKDFHISPNDASYSIYKMYNFFSEKKFDSLLMVAEQQHLPSFMGIAYIKLGQPAKALKLIHDLRAQIETNWFGSTADAVFSNPHQDIAIIYAWLNEKDKAMDELELAYRLRERSLLGIRYNILFDPLRSEQRFKDLVKRLGTE